MKIAVIGSGLSAYGAIKSLVDKGIKPNVLDKGDTLPLSVSHLSEKLSKLPTNQWLSQDQLEITKNDTIRNSEIPKKLQFGSDYFYGKSLLNAKVEGEGDLPPFSYAKGGLSVGWGGAILPAHKDDLSKWPITNLELNPYYTKVLEHLPLSAVDDELSLSFPLFKAYHPPLKLAEGNQKLLNWLRKTSLLNKESLVFGQGRLMTRAEDKDNKAGCKYCAMCMSGCVYKCIYKGSDGISDFYKKGLIEYQNGILVDHLEEVDGRVELYYFENENNELKKMLFDKVILAAGAVNSTRIILKSLKLYDKKISMKSRGGFIMPMFSLRPLKHGLPNTNTQPGLFLEFKAPKLSNHWIHTQFSTANEMVFNKLNIKIKSLNPIQIIKKIVIKHLVVAFCNLHSDHSEDYILWLEKNTDGDVLRFKRSPINDHGKTLDLVAEELFQIGKKIGCFPLKFMMKKNSGSYHVGGTLPMMKEPVEATHTSLLGVPRDMKNIHIVDGSIFPSLPGTTIGLILMANSARIADEITN